jgi:hypothetical protein
VRSVRPILILAAPCALLTAYIYFHASLETFVVYILALSLWAGLWGYCASVRDRRSKGARTLSNRS